MDEGVNIVTPNQKNPLTLVVVVAGLILLSIGGIIFIRKSGTVSPLAEDDEVRIIFVSPETSATTSANINTESTPSASPKTSPKTTPKPSPLASPSTTPQATPSASPSD